MIRIRSVKPLDDFQVRLEFTDGRRKILNLKPYLRGPIFRPLLKDYALFRKARVDNELGTIVWPNGADIDPDVLAGTHRPAWEEEMPRGYTTQRSHLASVKETSQTYRIKKGKSKKQRM